VLIGENGTGKSTVMEALEILRLTASEHRFGEAFLQRHGDLRELKHHGSQRLRLSLEVEATPVLRTVIPSPRLTLRASEIPQRRG
jgi:predicted ATPase